MTRTGTKTNACAPVDGGASAWGAEMPDVVHILPQENGGKVQHRGEFACVGMQHEASDEDSGASEADGGDRSLIRFREFNHLQAGPSTESFGKLFRCNLVSSSVGVLTQPGPSANFICKQCHTDPLHQRPQFC
jgi:hypothetical protein